MRIVITAPSLDAAQNVSGIASIVAVIISHDQQNEYVHFQVGKPDADRRGVRWALGLARMYAKWVGILLFARSRVIHLNLALDRRSLIRDTPLILAARAMRRRIVVHVHGGRLFAQLPGTAWLRWLVRGVLTGRHPTIVLGAREAALFQQVSRRAKINVLPNCVDLEQALPSSRGYDATGALTLLFMGRIAPGKGLDVICEALGILRGRGCPVKFVLAGAGPDETRYVARLQDILGPDFAFAGVVSGREKTTLLRKCDIFVLPSLFEGLPMALLESMAFGLVPITTNVGSMGEVVTNGENGILLYNHSADELAGAVEMVASNPSMRERLSKNAIRYVHEHHEPSRYVARLNEIYRYE